MLPMATSGLKSMACTSSSSTPYIYNDMLLALDITPLPPDSPPPLKATVP